MKEEKRREAALFRGHRRGGQLSAHGRRQDHDEAWRHAGPCQSDPCF